MELKKLEETKDIKKLDKLSKWTLFFNDANEVDKEDIIKELSEEMEEINVATQILQRVSEDEKARAKYESRLKWIAERNTILNEVERVRKRAEQESKRAEQECKRAEQESIRAEQAEKRANETIKNSVLALITIMDKESIARTLNIEFEEVQSILTNSSTEV